MSSPLSSNSACYKLKLPKNMRTRTMSPNSTPPLKQNLDLRTGAATTLARSSIFVHGGFTVPLNLFEVSSQAIQIELLSKYPGDISTIIDTELFVLDIISRQWSHIESIGPSPSQRVYHSIVYHNGFLYMFGGMCLNAEGNLVSNNELWQFNLQCRKWTILSRDDWKVSRRFNCDMHLIVKDNSAVKDDDLRLKLCIVGGLNNLDQPVTAVDIFDLVTNKWETDYKIYANIADPHGDLAPHEKPHHKQKIPLKRETNFSVLLNEDFHSDEPVLVFYSPEEKKNPLVSLPITHLRPSGYRLPMFNQKYDAQFPPFHLEYPCGEVFGNSIVVSGFYPNCWSPHNYRIYLYNLPTGKWSSINWEYDLHGHTHQFTKMFVWASHHTAILLGGYDQQDWAPSVQRFDCMMTLSLPVTNVHHAASQSTSSSEPLAPKPHYKSHTDAVLSSYLQYMLPKKDSITSIGSVLPPYAVVLGRDTYEIYSKSFSDLVLVSMNGGEVPVPMYLLRKRWGREFDRLLAGGYARAVHDLETDATIEDETPASFSSEPTRRQMSTQSQGSRKTQALLFSGRSSRDGSVTSHNSPSLPATQPSSGGMVFRLPFQDNSSLQNLPSAGSPGGSQNLATPVEPKVKRTKSLSATSSSPVEATRRPSYTTPLTSRKASMVSRTSSISMPSNSSGRGSRRASSAGRLSTCQGTFGSLPVNTPLPPAQPMPLEPLPSITGSGAVFNNLSPKESPSGSPRSSASDLGLSYTHRGPESPRQGDSPAGRSLGESPLSRSFGEHLMSRTSIGDAFKPNWNAQYDGSGQRFNTDFQRVGDFQRLGDYQRLSGESQLQASSQLEVPPPKVTVEHVQNDDSFYEPLEPLAKIKTASSFSSLITADTLHASGGSQSTGENDSELEPMLIPRQLFLPYTHDCVKALAEFFFTGQVSPQWSFPVALDLFGVAKYYDIPLLYGLLAEAFYAVLGNKEHGMQKELRSLKKSYLKSARAAYGSDEAGALTAAAKSPALKEVLDLRDEIHQIGEGNFDIEALKDASRSLSIGSDISSNASFSDVSVNYIPGNAAATINRTARFSTKPKSSLSRQVDPDLASTETDSGPESECIMIDARRTSLVSNRTLEDAEPDEEDIGEGIGLMDRLALKPHFTDDMTGSFSSESTGPQRRKASDGLALERLASAHGTVPSDAIVGLVYEVATMVNDLRLMVRARAVTHFAKRVKVVTAKIGYEMSELDRMKKDRELFVEPKLTRSMSQMTISPVSSRPGIHTSQSSATLSTRKFSSLTRKMTEGNDPTKDSSLFGAAMSTVLTNGSQNSSKKKKAFGGFFSKRAS